MKMISLLLIAVGLSMDAFAVALCKGLALRKIILSRVLLIALWFGGFQALMPLLGYYLGEQFQVYIVDYDHWIAFAALCLIGISMLREAFSHKEDDASTADREAQEFSDSLSIKVMFPLALATSIDALAVGVTFAFLQVNIWISIALIGSITFVLSLVGVWIGNLFGITFKAKAQIAGGIVLILMGGKILLEHLEILPTIAL
ncbi:MAG: manganese efflux pump MntP family protein [Lachnospiraceae bacterium]|jgi:putative Mn2+ efflux pump MntP|nr:manganese efflux pump MntP family protein [Lachnospiraceae bacterium]